MNKIDREPGKKSIENLNKISFHEKNEIKKILSVPNERTNKRTGKLFVNLHFRCPKNHTNDEKAVKIFFELVEEVKTRCLFSKRHNTAIFFLPSGFVYMTQFCHKYHTLRGRHF